MCRLTVDGEIKQFNCKTALTAIKRRATGTMTTIKLDKNFDISIHGGEQYIERGYDGERGMHYCQLFFREEKDRIVFQNPGAFPLGMTWQDFVNDQIGSLPANPTIANVFYRRGMMEAWGRGIGLIMESCREQGLLAPEIKVVPSFVNLTIWFKQALTGRIKTSAPQAEDSYTPSHTPSDDDFTPSHNEIHDQSNIIAPQEKVFEFCSSPKSIAEIADMLGVNDRRWVRKKYIAPFIGTKLQMTIPDKPNSQNQKYISIE